MNAVDKRASLFGRGQFNHLLDVRAADEGCGFAGVGGAACEDYGAEVRVGAEIVAFLDQVGEEGGVDDVEFSWIGDREGGDVVAR